MAHRCCGAAPHDIEERLDDPWRQSHAHLVDQEDLRLRDEGAGDGEHLLLATGEGAAS
jgi:hypothetical protein